MIDRLSTDLFFGVKFGELDLSYSTVYIFIGISSLVFLAVGISSIKLIQAALQNNKE